MNIDLYNEDCIEGLKRIPDGNVDVVLTDPPYLYLKNQKLERQFDEHVFFEHVKRILKKDGFVVIFGRGTSFYRWNTILADLGFQFKEEIIWDKSYTSSPLMAISRVHETVSIHTKGKGVINRCKVPYLEMKGHDTQSIMQDIKRMSAILHNPKSLKAVEEFLKNNKCIYENGKCHRYHVSAQTGFGSEDRLAAVMRGMSVGLTEKSIVRIDLETSSTANKHNFHGNMKIGNRSVNVISSISCGQNEKTIIRTDFHGERKGAGIVRRNAGWGDRSCNVMQSIEFGQTEKTIIKQPRDHYATIHPTQKPVRLLERLLNLVSKPGAVVVDPFMGSGSTGIACLNSGRHFIGYEIDKEYFDKASARIAEHQQEMGLFANTEIA